MPRFLTPSRICLLVLIELYLSGEVATSSRLKLLNCIADNIETSTAQGDEGLSSLPWSEMLAFEAILSPLQSVMPGRSLFDLFLQKVWSLTSLDSIYSLFERLAILIQSSATESQPSTTRVSRASPLGQCIRRCSVDFTRLPFEDSHALWHALVLYRAPSLSAWAAKHGESQRMWEGEASEENDLVPPLPQVENDVRPALICSEDTEGLIAFSIEKLQKLGTRLDSATKRKLQTWLSAQSEVKTLSLNHFITFLEQWRAGQYSMALESLHRYFDYSLNGRLEGDNVRIHYQYALLHLSVLHADFDCWEESVDAMDECIATGQYLPIFGVGVLMPS